MVEISYCYPEAVVQDLWSIINTNKFQCLLFLYIAHKKFSGKPYIPLTKSNSNDQQNVWWSTLHYICNASIEHSPTDTVRYMTKAVCPKLQCNVLHFILLDPATVCTIKQTTLMLFNALCLLKCSVNLENALQGSQWRG